MSSSNHHSQTVHHSTSNTISRVNWKGNRRSTGHWIAVCYESQRLIAVFASGLAQSHVESSPYLLTPCCRVLLEKLTGLQLVKKFPSFHGTRRFITALTSVRHLSLSWASPIQSIYPHPTSWRSILLLYTHLRLGLPSGLFPSGFPTKTLYTSLSSLISATCPAHPILLDFITRTILGEEYKSLLSYLLKWNWSGPIREIG